MPALAFLNWEKEREKVNKSRKKTPYVWCARLVLMCCSLVHRLIEWRWSFVETKQNKTSSHLPFTSQAQPEALMWWKRSTNTNWQCKVNVQIQSDFDQKKIERLKERRIEHARKRPTERMWRSKAKKKKNVVNVSKLQSIDVILLLLFAILFISWISVSSLILSLFRSAVLLFQFLLR